MYRVEHGQQKLFVSARSLEIGLKWMTGILSSVAIILAISLIFIACYCRRIHLRPETAFACHRDPKYNVEK